MTYRIAIKPSARKELEGLEDTVLRRVDRAIVKLSDNPRLQGSKKLTGVPLHRIRVGDYRVVYEVDDDQQNVTIVAIRHRREAYRT